MFNERSRRLKGKYDIFVLFIESVFTDTTAVCIKHGSLNVYCSYCNHEVKLILILECEIIISGKQLMLSDLIFRPNLSGQYIVLLFDDILSIRTKYHIEQNYFISSQLELFE